MCVRIINTTKTIQRQNELREFVIHESCDADDENQISSLDSVYTYILIHPYIVVWIHSYRTIRANMYS